MQRVLLTISCLSTRFVVNSEETCGEYLLPKDPVHFSRTHGSQWRLLALAGQKQDGTIITGDPSEPMYPTVIRGHWAIGELEFFEDPNCEGNKHPSLKKDGPVLAPMHTTYSWQDDTPDELPFAAGVESPWYSEMRALDGCSSSEFWSSCYQCAIPQAWYGVVFINDDPNVTQIKCVKVFQKDADAYTATHVELQRWEPPVNGTEGSWKKKGAWTGLNGGRWFVLKDNATAAVAGAPGSAMPSLLLGLFGFLLWAGL
eukprot:gnl/MRDRNA2_/MRDRNA2_95420_c0_seq1.p1 gnl/MRDRNA2_/MRDRNA2_95420_c0~~gnl/MRDRNA2_/MRDRNA2_95420_c0_seq1.p1  ORF type:complete len:257 (+),score=42.48 gnl/MRDRNA2_/MRDRNA2_95420_c0_seq1:82-852(+)